MAERRNRRASAGGLRGGPVLARDGRTRGRLGFALAADLLRGAAGTYTVTNGAMGLAFAACGTLLAWHRPKNPIGWLLLAAGLAQATSTAASSLLALGQPRGWSLGALRLIGTLTAYPWLSRSGSSCRSRCCCSRTDGAGRPWRWLIWAALIDGALFVLSFASPAPHGDRGVPGHPVPDHRRSTPASPRSGPPPSSGGRSFRRRSRRWRCGTAVATTTLRRQLLWLLLAGLAAGAFTVPWGIFGTGPILGLLVIPLIPAAITIAILRHQLLDIRLVVSSALLYGLLTAVCVGSYVGLLALFDALVHQGEPGLRGGGELDRRDRVQPGPGLATAAGRPRLYGDRGDRCARYHGWASGSPDRATSWRACSKHSASPSGCPCGGKVRTARGGRLRAVPELRHGVT